MICAISVTGKDCTGIIAALTETIFKTGGNLEDASMTILEGEFAMIVLVAYKNKKGNQKLISQLGKIERKMNLTITVKKIMRPLRRGEKHKTGTIPYIVSVFGKDRSGIVYHVSKLLAQMRLNITDLNSKITGSGAKTAYTLILEVDVPRSIRLINRLKRAFNVLQKKLRVHIALSPAEPIQF